jgi:hypothetical protein
MVALLLFLLAVLALPFKSKSRLEAENAALRHQLVILRRKVHGRVLPSNSDRLFFVVLYCWFPSILQVLTVVRPETLARWHRAGFRLYWRWKSRSQGGRLQIDAELRALIRRMSVKTNCGEHHAFMASCSNSALTAISHQIYNLDIRLSDWFVQMMGL